MGLFFIPILLQTPGGEKTDNRLSMEGERTEIEMTGIRHVKVVEKLGKIDKDHIGVLGKLDVETSHSSGKSIFVSEKSIFACDTRRGLLID